MNRYRYIGRKRNLIGMTALGKFQGNKFLVQVDLLSHRYSHWWWQQNPNNWVKINE